MKRSAWMRWIVGVGIGAAGTFAAAIAQAQTVGIPVPQGPAAFQMTGAEAPALGGLLDNVAVLIWAPLLLVTLVAVGVLVLLIWRQREAPVRKPAPQREPVGFRGSLAISAAKR